MIGIKRLLELLSSYSFHLYYIKGKDMILSDFLSRQEHDDSNLHEIIPISFNMQGVLHTRYYNIGEGNSVKYLVQTQSQERSSGIKLPEVHGIGKGLDMNIHPEKQVVKPIARLGQGRAGLRHKIKTKISILLMHIMEKPPPEALQPNTSKIQDRTIPTPNFATPQVKPKVDTSTKIIDRNAIQEVGREIPIYPDPVYRSPPKPEKTSIPNIPESLLDIDPELTNKFKDNSPFQEGVISEMYQRPDKSYFQEPQELESLINTGRLIQKFLPRQADINKILKDYTKKTC